MKDTDQIALMAAILAGAQMIACGKPAEYLGDEDLLDYAERLLKMARSMRPEEW